MQRYQLYLLGPVRTFDPDGVELPLGTKARALLGYLGWEIETPTSRARLQDIFWGNADHTRGRDNLKKALQRLSATFAQSQGILISRNGHVQLNRRDLWIDCYDDPQRFMRDRDLLEGSDIGDEHFEVWLRQARATWDRLRRDDTLPNIQVQG